MKYEIIHVSDLGNTPAACDRGKKIIYVNDKVWFTIPEAFQRIILLHEAGHIALNTSSEILSDDFAFEYFAGTQTKSLKKLVNVLDMYLDLMNEEDKIRFFSMAKNVLEYDAIKNGNDDAKILLNELNKLEVMKAVNLKEKIDTFLQKKGIANIDKLNPDAKVALLVEFSKDDDIQALSNVSSFDGSDGIAVAASAALTGFGIPVSPEMVDSVVKIFKKNGGAYNTKGKNIQTADLIAQGYQFLGEEGQTVTIPNDGCVAFGINGAYVYKEYKKGDRVDIRYWTFGDPAPNIKKQAYFKSFEAAMKEIAKEQIGNEVESNISQNRGFGAPVQNAKLKTEATKQDESVPSTDNTTKKQPAKASESEPEPTQPKKDASTDNKKWYIIGGVAVVVIIVIALIFKGNGKLKG